MAIADIYELVFPISAGEDRFSDNQASTIISQVAGTVFL
jgi:hypothetical protein